jgi:SAM-dependent methyltransferase
VPGLAKNLLSLATPAFWRQQYANWRARRFDHRHGIETSVVVPVDELRDVDPTLARHAVHYEPSTLPKFERAMRALKIEYSRYTFIDYGSGKGRVLLLAARYPFRRVIGVEMSAALNVAAAANIAAYQRRNPLQSAIELVAGDARDLPVPEDDLVAYLYNPFDEVVLRAVWDRLRASIRLKPRSLFVVYVNPLHRRLFDDSSELRCVYDEPAVVVYRATLIKGE